MIVNQNHFFEGDIDVSIQDVTGQDLHEEKIASLNEQKELRFDLPTAFPNGIYQVSIENNGKTHQQKVVYFK